MNTPKRTRAERKAARNEQFKRLEALQAKQKGIRAAYEAAHPVTCGLIPVVDYIAPR